LIILANAASALTLDELLSFYDWNINNPGVTVNSITYSNIDTDSNTRYDTISFSISVAANDNLRYIGFLGESGFEGQKTVSGTGILQINFSSSDFEEGDYNFSFKIFDSNNNLIIDAYDNQTYHFSSAQHELPNVNVAFSSFASENTDADGLYELLSANINLDVNIAGDYKIIGYLKQDSKYIKTERYVTLSTGTSSQKISFSSKDMRIARFDGAVILDSVEVIGNSFDRIFAVSQQTTIDSADFDPETTIITGGFIDTAVDSGTDGSYDIINLSFIVNFNESEVYDIIGSVDDYYGNHILDFNVSQAQTAGIRAVTIPINATDIWKTKINGPYRIDYIKIKKGNELVDLFLDPYVLSSVSDYIQLEPLPLPDLTVHFTELKDIGNNYSDVKIRVENIGQKLAIKAVVGLYNDNSDELGSKTVYFLKPSTEKILEFQAYTEDTSRLITYVDIEDIVEESNEMNNIDWINLSSIVIDSTPPASVTGLSVYNKGTDWIYFVWNNPHDDDFSHCVIYLDGDNIRTTTDEYINLTGLNEGTSYELRIETVDINENVNDSVVNIREITLIQGQVSISGIKLDKYWLYGGKNQDIDFDAGWYYPEQGITDVLWNFGDSASSTDIKTTHRYSQTGNYTAILTINSNIRENMTVFITEESSYNYDSLIPYFSFENSSATLIGAMFGNDAINGYVTDNDFLMVYAIAKLDGDDNISIRQVQLSGYDSEKCWPIGSGYFKCFVFWMDIRTVSTGNWSWPFRLYDDSEREIVNMVMSDISEKTPPSIIFNPDLTYFVSDSAYTGMRGSGVGKVNLYIDGTLNQSIKVDADNYSSQFTFNPDVADGEEKSFELCINASDRTRLSASSCRSIVADRKAPMLNYLKIIGDITAVPIGGVSINITANISDISQVTAIADFTAINIDNPTGYSNKHADSCLREGSFWICTWNNITVKLNSGGDYNITVSLSDQLGNSRQAVSTERIAAVNHAPVVSVSNITVSEGSLITITPSATDLDGDTITFSYSGWMNSSTYQTTYHDQGTYQVTVTANDGFDGTDSKTITVRVNNVNVPDLEISNISFKPAMPVSNTPIMLRFVIINIGEVPAQDIRWEIVDSSAVVSTQQDLFDLDTDEDIAVYALVKYPAPGIYNPRISVDPTDNIKEIYEDNNEDSVQIVVG